MKRTVVLTSTENFVWHSMQEIIPMIERTWLDSGSAGVHEVFSINVDRMRLSEHLPLLLQADNIVLSCFTTKLAKTAQMLRKQLSIDARYFIYLHNQATIACWPFHVWGMGEVLRSSDVFISSSARDAAALPLSFQNARVETIPFTLPDAAGLPDEAPPSADHAKVPFVYVGRISAQKNLHSLLLAYALFLERDPGYEGELRVYGGDDQLGSPNMGMKQTDYLKTLHELAVALKLQTRMRFFGHLDREALIQTLSSESHILVSASLHSDENFGMAAFRSLCLGQCAVLSDWGGHADLPSAFPGRVSLVRVQGSASGPWLSPTDFASAMAASQLASKKTAAPRIPPNYESARISERLLHLATEDHVAGSPLLATPLARRITERRERMKIFDSYEDADAALFFRAYGMLPPQDARRAQEAYLPPWCQIGGNSIRVEDPHRGHFRIPLSDQGPHRLLDLRGKEAHVSRETLTTLLSQGFAFNREDPREQPE